MSNFATVWRELVNLALPKKRASVGDNTKHERFDAERELLEQATRVRDENNCTLGLTRDTGLTADPRNAHRAAVRSPPTP
jgi:hypothetical protein